MPSLTIFRYPPATRKEVDEFSISDNCISGIEISDDLSFSNSEISVEEIVVVLSRLITYNASIFPVNKNEMRETKGTSNFNFADAYVQTDAWF